MYDITKSLREIAINLSIVMSRQNQSKNALFSLLLFYSKVLSAIALEKAHVQIRKTSGFE